jgi:hypothetical protein
MTRVNVPVSDRARSEVNEHPDQFGLDPSQSEAQRFSELVEEGMRARRERVRNERRVEMYEQYKADPAYHEELDAAEVAAFASGGF